MNLWFSTLGTIISILIEDLLPRDCVLCGSPRRTGMPDSSLLSARRFIPMPPLCAACLRALVPIHGERCSRCGKLLISEFSLCMHCRRVDHAYDGVIPLFMYAGHAASLVAAYKAGRRRSLAPWLASLIEAEVLTRWPSAQIVPVPPRPVKAGGRDFDPIETLARQLTRRGIPVLRYLERTASQQQKHLDRDGRRLNAARSFHLRPGCRASGIAVLLDDVYTTGSTIDRCASLLKECGFSQVYAIVLAVD